MQYQYDTKYRYMIPDKELRAVYSCIKDAMKKKGLTYADLAKAMKLSESSVKRLMANRDLSLERVNFIADWLGMSIFELFDLAKSKHPSAHIFTKAQDLLLANDGLAAYVFLQLLVGYSTEEVAKRYKISESRMFGTLRKLDQVDLIRLNPGGRIVVRTRGPFIWQKLGLMERKYLKRFADSILHNMKLKALGSTEDLEKGLSKPFEFYLSQNSIRLFRDELLEVIRKFKSQAAWEKLNVNYRDLQVISGFVGFDAWNAWEKVLLGK